MPHTNGYRHAIPVGLTAKIRGSAPPYEKATWLPRYRRFFFAGVGLLSMLSVRK